MVYVWRGAGGAQVADVGAAHLVVFELSLRRRHHRVEGRDEVVALAVCSVRVVLGGDLLVDDAREADLLHHAVARAAVRALTHLDPIIT